jgi:hypothetical protein
VLELVERDDHRPRAAGLVAHELQGVGPGAEAGRRRAGHKRPALLGEGLDLKGARLLLRLQVDDAVPSERDAQEEGLADAPPPPQDHQGRRVGGELPEQACLSPAIDDSCRLAGRIDARSRVANARTTAPRSLARGSSQSVI